MKISLDIVPDKIIRQYNIRALDSNFWVYMEIRKGMPGLKQARHIENDRHQPSPMPTELPPCMKKIFLRCSRPVR